MYKPQKVQMEADTNYQWAFDPAVQFKTNVSGVSYICTCGQTKTAPYCDGTHIQYNANLARNGEQSLPKESAFDNGSR